MSDSPATTKRQTIAAFEAFLKRPENADRLFELIDGEIVEKLPTEFHNLIRDFLLVTLWNFIVPRKLGRVTAETRTRANVEDRYNDRLPDISFTRAERVLPVVKTGAVPQIPDLCIKVQSPDDYPKMMREKAEYYLQNGAQQVWLVYTKKEFVEVLFADGNYDHYLKGEVLSGGDLIPGFSLAIDDLFDVSER
ncbi:MAG: Uma2 family endonuclease [Anaerolineae bacterium]|nr:Uma2 family endonuclease [Anaerolineae bacterium]